MSIALRNFFLIFSISLLHYGKCRVILGILHEKGAAIMTNNKEIGKRIEQRRKQLGLTLDDISAQISVARSTVQRYEKGAIEKIKIPVLEAIAKALQVSPAWLSCKTDKMWDTDISKIPGAIPYVRGRRIPIIGSIPAGTPVLAQGDIEGYDYADVPEGEDYFFLRVNGDSMINAGIRPGDLVLIKQQSCADSGNIVACIVNGDEATLKRFYQKGDIVILQPGNAAYAPVIVPCKDFETGGARIIGVVTESKRKYL
jgi:repressor LexA